MIKQRKSQQLHFEKIPQLITGDTTNDAISKDSRNTKTLLTQFDI